MHLINVFDYYINHDTVSLSSHTLLFYSLLSISLRLAIYIAHNLHQLLYSFVPVHYWFGAQTPLIALVPLLLAPLIHVLIQVPLLVGYAVGFYVANYRF